MTEKTDRDQHRHFAGQEPSGTNNQRRRPNFNVPGSQRPAQQSPTEKVLHLVRLAKILKSDDANCW